MSKSKQEWEETSFSKATARFKERKEHFESSSGASIDPLYGPL